MNKSSPWLISQAKKEPRFRVYCFPYAGGSAGAFMPWQSAVPADVEICAVNLPSRGARWNEPAPQSMESVVQAMVGVLSTQDATPYALLGHSLGACMAFELARACQAQGLAMPQKLFVSGCDAPQVRVPPTELHQLPDDQLIEALQHYNGTPPEVLAHEELMQLVLPVIRADFSIAANYAYRPGPTLDIPITVLCGKQDPHVQAEHVSKWQAETTGACSVHWFDGDHFFIDSARSTVLARINAELQGCIAAAGGYASTRSVDPLR